MALILDPTSASQWRRALHYLKEGLPVGLPTETVYGLGALATREESLARIFSLKNRPTFDPLIVHVLPQIEWVKPLVKDITPLHHKLMAHFWPGPLTLLFEKSDLIPDLCTATMPWVALRSPSHPVF